MEGLVGYGSDSDGSGINGSDSEPEAETKPVKPPPKKKKSLLPSAADAFANVGSASFLMPTSAVAEPEIVPIKKKSKPEESEKTKQAVLLPPQIGRGGPNKSTEDVSRWTSKAALEASEKKKEEKKKESWNTKEKRKRQEGKVGREGSWVEEEKRLLRQAGAD